MVGQTCAQVSSANMIVIDKNSMYSKGSFEAQQVHHKQQILTMLKRCHKTIENALNEMRTLFKGSCNLSVKEEWKALITKIDQTFETSLFEAVKNSLSLLRDSLKRSDLCLFSIKIVLDQEQIGARPSMIDLTHIINTISKDVIRALSHLERIHIPLEDCDQCNDNQSMTYYSVISTNPQVISTLAQVMSGMASCTGKIKEEMDIWYAHKALWEVDKDAYMRRCIRTNRTLQTISNDIETYNESENSIIELRPSSYQCRFLTIDVTLLKNKLLQECRDWKSIMYTVLHKSAYHALTKIVEDDNRNASNMCANDVEKVRQTYRELLESEVKISAEEQEYLDRLWDIPCPKNSSSYVNH